MIPLLFLPKEGHSENDDQDKKQKKGSSLSEAFKKYPFVPVLFLAFSFLFIFHTIISTSITQILNSYGGGSQDVGTALMIAGLCELPVMFGFNWLVKIKPSTFWLGLSSIFFVVRSITVMLAPNLMTVEISQFFQTISFALFIPASAYMMNDYLDVDDTVLGQTIITAAMTLGGIISNIIGGYLLDLWNVHVLMAFATACAAIGMALTMLGIKSAKNLRFAKTIQQK